MEYREENKVQKKKHYKWGIRKQLVFFTTILAIITYTTSAFFIYGIFPLVKDFIGVGEVAFTIVTLILGIIWSGILAFFAATFIVKPLQKLEVVALQAAQGNISENVELALSNQAEEVAAIAEETAAGTQQVKIAISHQTEMMESVLNLTVDLKSQAEKLKSTITKFKL